MLEVGCGDGQFFEKTTMKLANKYFGMDFSKSLLWKFSRKYDNVTLLEKNIFELKLLDKFDIITSNAVIQYFNDEKTLEFLDICNDLLAENGRILIFNAYWKRSLFEYLSGGFKEDPDDINFFKGMARWIKIRGRPRSENWHDLYLFSEWAKQNNFSFRYVNSMSHMPRIHVIMEKI